MGVCCPGVCSILNEMRLAKPILAAYRDEASVAVAPRGVELLNRRARERDGAERVGREGGGDAGGDVVPGLQLDLRRLVVRGGRRAAGAKGAAGRAARRRNRPSANAAETPASPGLPRFPDDDGPKMADNPIP